MMFSKISLQRVKKIGDQLAIQVWMDYAPPKLPEYWREVLVERSVGERKRDGTVRLNRRGRRLRAEIVQARDDEAAASSPTPRSEHESAQTAAGPSEASSPVDLRSRDPALGMMSRRLPWREILARCTGPSDPMHARPKNRIAQ